jgi:hypothetical protein
MIVHMLLGLFSIAACVAAQYGGHGEDRYAEDGEPTYDTFDYGRGDYGGYHHGVPRDHGLQREASGDAEAIHAWEEAHGGQPVKYESNFGAIPEVHGHYMEARDEERKPSAAPSSTRLVPEFEPVPDFGGVEVDTSMEGYDHELLARHLQSENPDIDVSLNGYERRSSSSDSDPPSQELHEPWSPYGEDDVPFDWEVPLHARDVDWDAFAESRDWADFEEYEERVISSVTVEASKSSPPTSIATAIASEAAGPKVDGQPVPRNIKKWWEHLTADSKKAGEQAGHEIKSVAQQLAHHIREAPGSVAGSAGAAEPASASYVVEEAAETGV